MQYTDIQIEAIQIFGRKEFTEGCIVESWDFWEVWQYLIRIKDRIYIRTGDFITNRHCTEIKEILWHEPQWHDVFAKLKEEWYKSELTTEWELLLFRTDQSDYITLEEEIPCNPCISPMEQPLLIEELLKLIK